MSESQPPPPRAPEPHAQSSHPVSTNPGDSGNANLIYILYLVSLAVGITAIVGVVMAYMAKDQAPDWLRSHYRNQIHVFWKGLLYAVIGLVLSVVLIGFVVLLVVLIWFIVRTVKGMQALSKSEAYPNPDGWGF